MRGTKVFTIALWIWLVFAPLAGAQPSNAGESVPGPRFPWTWERFSAWEYAVSGSALAGSLAMELAVPPPSTAGWRGGILFDDGARGLLRFHSRSGRRSADVASTILVCTLTAYPVFDAAVLVWGVYGSFDAAYQLLLLDLQSFAITFLTTDVTKRAVRRERPEKRECRSSADPSTCDVSSPYESFFSGHTSRAFTAAGLTCAQHLYGSLYGPATADALACAASLTAATATGVLRVAADKHYLTDVLAGAGVGFSSGYLLPALLHFDRPRKPDSGPELKSVGVTWHSGGPLVALAGRL